jgi:site-specific DNA-adenine methylase
MPFAYYGAKHGLARHYPRPTHDTIIEPFAGSAGYSVKWANPSQTVILLDVDPQVVALWHRVQQLTETDLIELSRHAANDETTTDPLIAASAGGTNLAATLAGKTRVITPRMRQNWPVVRRRITRALPRVRTWQIINDTYNNAPNIAATWHVDPPYQPLIDYTSFDGAGNGYRHSTINYEHLAQWCQTRQGQTMVCEQSPAAWLPFQPFKQQKSGMNSKRLELIWTNKLQQKHNQATIW